ncbi:hypothetical protein CPLU01_09647 [Colletotrichum plurivorum]|uniref:Uncharacterized protein n=1 Tax=Colletotrichum plurivorum TaxID=2175906 RepID=A0A8H6K956_9PEZI|nr:hypothetical protein CPLU01_09647 [Colletotrichum plurivorum]
MSFTLHTLSGRTPVPASQTPDTRRTRLRLPLQHPNVAAVNFTADLRRGLPDAAASQLISASHYCRRKSNMYAQRRMARTTASAIRRAGETFNTWPMTVVGFVGRRPLRASCCQGVPNRCPPKAGAASGPPLSRQAVGPGSAVGIQTPLFAWGRRLLR